MRWYNSGSTRPVKGVELFGIALGQALMRCERTGVDLTEEEWKGFARVHKVRKLKYDHYIKVGKSYWRPRPERRPSVGHEQAPGPASLVAEVA